MTTQDKEKIISRIVELSLEETKLISQGYKPYINDQYQSKRNELELLRCLLFGYNSQYCKINKGSNGTLFY